MLWNEQQMVIFKHLSHVYYQRFHTFLVTSTYSWSGSHRDAGVYPSFTERKAGKRAVQQAIGKSMGWTQNFFPSPIGQFRVSN